MACTPNAESFRSPRTRLPAQGIRARPRPPRSDRRARRAGLLNQLLGARESVDFSRRVEQPACSAVGQSGFRFHDLRHSRTPGGLHRCQPKGTHTPDWPRRPEAALIDQYATTARDRAVADASSALAVPKPASAELPNRQLVTREDGNSPPRQTSADGGGCGCQVPVSSPGSCGMEHPRRSFRTASEK
jgi:hypothetical protein